MVDRISALLTLHISLIIALLLFGVTYAWHIYYRPMPRTWLSVAVGTGAIAIIGSLDIAGSLYIFGLWTGLYWMAFIPEATLLIAGIPMAWVQEYKFRQQRRRNREITEVWRNADK